MSVLLFFSSLATFAVQATDGELAARTEAFEVRLLGHEEGDHSMLRNFRVRKYLFEATTKTDGKKILISLGGDYFPAFDELEEVRIVGDRLVVTAHTGIYVLDLHDGKRLKFLRTIGPTSSPSGRFIVYREWQTRAMPEEMLGAIVSVLDLQTLERQVVYPVMDLLRKSRPTDTDDEIEPYFKNWEEDPRKRCFTSRLLWTADDSRVAFLCTYYQAGLHGPGDLALVVVSPITGLKAATPQRFDIPDEAFLVPGVEATEEDSPWIEESGWLNDIIFEIRLRRKPWLRKRILIDVAVGEVWSEP